METIKIEVSVNLNLSDDVKKFVMSLISAPTPVPTQAPTLVPTQAPAPAAPAPAPAAPKAPDNAPTIEDVRKALASKVSNHREEIKAKLDELGAPSVTKLDPEKYPEMLNFLNSLD